MSKTMNHAEYAANLRAKSTEELDFIANDAAAALRAMPESSNASYYADEVCYVANEKARRQRIAILEARLNSYTANAPLRMKAATARELRALTLNPNR